MPIKSFRGQLVTGQIESIALHTNTGSTGYKIVKFELMSPDPIGEDQEAVVKVFTVAQATATQTIDFSDQTLIAAGFYENEN